MNNTIKIIIAGGIGTIVQKVFGLSGFSLSGFVVFMVVFVALKFFLDVTSPSKELLETKRTLRDIMAMSLISTKEINGKYYIYLTKQQLYRGNMPNQLYYIKKNND